MDEKGRLCLTAQKEELPPAQRRSIPIGMKKAAEEDAGGNKPKHIAENAA